MCGTAATSTGCSLPAWGAGLAQQCPAVSVPRRRAPDAHLGCAGRTRCGRLRSWWPAPGARSPWAGGRGLDQPRCLLSALALSLPRGGRGALGPQVGGVGLRDLQDAAHGADRPHQLLGRGRGLRHGTPRLRAAPRGGPGRGEGAGAPGGEEGAGPGGTGAPGRRWPSGGKGRGAGGRGSAWKGSRYREPGERHQRGRRAAERG